MPPWGLGGATHAENALDEGLRQPHRVGEEGVLEFFERVILAVGLDFEGR